MFWNHLTVPWWWSSSSIVLVRLFSCFQSSSRNVSLNTDLKRQTWGKITSHNKLGNAFLKESHFIFHVLLFYQWGCGGSECSLIIYLLLCISHLSQDNQSCLYVYGYLHFSWQVRDIWLSKCQCHLKNVNDSITCHVHLSINYSLTLTVTSYCLLAWCRTLAHWRSGVLSYDTTRRLSREKVRVTSFEVP